MQFRLSQGPWTKMFEGNVEGQSVEIHSNEESMVLVQIFEKEKDKTIGVVLELFKVFACTGEIESFVESLPKDAMVFLKHAQNKTMKFLMVASSPTYSEFKEEKFIAEFDSILRKLNESSQTLTQIAKAYEIELAEINKANEEERQAFFAEPISMLSMTRTAIEARNFTAGETDSTIAAGTGEFLLGLTREGTIVKEPLELFKKTMITGFNEKQRMHIAHLVIEGALLSSLAAVVIDWKNSFRGLAEPTKDLAGLRKFKVDFEPIGFPVAHFTVPENVRIELGMVDMPALFELFGLGENIVGKIVQENNAKKKFSSTKELIEEIKKAQPTEEKTAYQLNKAVRILSLFELHYPKLLGRTNNFEDLSKSWMKGLGRAGVIHLENAEEKTALLVLQTVIRGLLEYYKKQGKTNRLRAMIIIPDAKRILPATQAKKAHALIANDLNELAEYGVGFALAAERAAELNSAIVNGIESEIGLIDNNDVGVKIKNRKNYRVLLRPGLSACTEI